MLTGNKMHHWDSHTYHSHRIMTSSNRNIFRVTSLLWGEFTGHRWIPLTRVRDAELWCFLNKRLSKQPWGWWFETPSCPLSRHCNDKMIGQLNHWWITPWLPLIFHFADVVSSGQADVALWRVTCIVTWPLPIVFRFPGTRKTSDWKLIYDKMIIRCFM